MNVHIVKVFHVSLKREGSFLFSLPIPITPPFVLQIEPRVSRMGGKHWAIATGRQSVHSMLFLDSELLGHLVLSVSVEL